MTVGDQLNFLWPSTVYETNGSYFIRRPWNKNEFSNHFDLVLFSKIEKVDTIDQNKYLKLDDDITVVDFFEQLTTTHVIRKYHTYATAIRRLTNPQSDYYIVLYPYRKISVVLANMLKEFNLSVWVKSDYVGLFGIPEDSTPRSYLKTALSPGVRLLFPLLTKKIFKNNLVFYTGDILYSESDHITQQEVTDLSPLNRERERVRGPYLDNIVFIGDESNQKGLVYLLKALRRVNRDLSLTIIGMNQLSRFSEYTRYVDVTVKGEVYDHDRFYDMLSEHDALVMPSICERQGKVQLEAMSTGVVPICSDSGGTFTTINHLHNGLLFPPRDVDGLINEINRLYSDKALYFDLQRKGLEYTSNLSVSEEIGKMATIMKRYYE